MYPTPLQATGHDEVYVGRVFRHLTSLNQTAFIWCVGDNIRRVQLSNAIQIAGILRRRRFT